MASIGFWCDGNGVKRPRSNRKNGGKFKFSFLKKRLYLCYLWVYWAKILSVVSFSRFHYHFWHFQWLARSIKVWPRKRREIQILLWLRKAQSHQANKLPFSWTLKDMSQRRRGGISASGRMYILIWNPHNAPNLSVMGWWKFCRNETWHYLGWTLLQRTSDSIYCKQIKCFCKVKPYVS